MANVPVSDLPQGLKNQLCVSYAVLLLNDSQQDISVDNLTKVLKAAKANVRRLSRLTLASSKPSLMLWKAKT
jgi:hypothetical protein